MGILDRAAQRLGYTRADAAPAPSTAPAAPAQPRQWRADDFAGVLGAYAGKLQYNMPTGLVAGEELYATDGLAARIIDKPAEDAVARWFEVEGDERDDVLGELDRLNAPQILQDSLRWARLFGASAIMPLVDDGQPLDAPLDLGRVRRVTDLLTYSAPQITMRAERYSDPTLPNYGWPEAYDIRPRYGVSFAVHETRLFPVSGDPLSYTAAQNARLPWLGRGVLEGCFADLQRYREVLRLAKLLVFRKQQPVHGMSGLGEMLSAGLDDIVAKRLETADLARSILTTVAVDAEDRFDVIDTSLSGIRDIVLEDKVALCASSGVPMLVLFGEETRGGLSNSGEGQHEAWHKVLEKEQTRLQTATERLVALIYSQQSFNRPEPPSWNIRWRELWSPTEQEAAATAKAEAEAKRAAVEAISALAKGGLATPDECRALVREQVYETLPSTALPAEDDTEPQGEAESARKAAMEAITALLDAGLASPEEGRDLARRLFPDLSEGPPPPELEPEPTPEPAPSTETDTTEEGREP